MAVDAADRGGPKEHRGDPVDPGYPAHAGAISLGDGLGTRATLTVTLSDHRHIFAGESFEAGTFFGKWRGRYGQRLRGQPLRWRRGVGGQSLDAMETWHFIVEAVDGPTPDGHYTHRGA